MPLDGPVLLATCDRLPDGDEDALLLTEALDRLGVQSRWAAWDDRDVAWSDSLVVLRSTWDYTARRDEFLAWVDAMPRVANAADVVRWSSDKTYLVDLEDRGLPIVPTLVVRPGDDWTWPDADEVVAKPSVGAGSRGVGRFTRDREAAAREHVAALHAAGRSVLVQPYLETVDTAGETALIYLDGVYSHAIRKAPMLPAGVVHAADSSDLYVPESILPRTPTGDERLVGDATLEAVRSRFGADPLYARVDLLPGPTGPAIVELELVEPSLFLVHATGDAAPDAPGSAADRLAAAVAARA